MEYHGLKIDITAIAGLVGAVSTLIFTLKGYRNKEVTRVRKQTETDESFSPSLEKDNDPKI